MKIVKSGDVVLSVSQTADHHDVCMIVKALKLNVFGYLDLIAEDSNLCGSIAYTTEGVVTLKDVTTGNTSLVTCLSWVGRVNNSIYPVANDDTQAIENGYVTIHTLHNTDFVSLTESYCQLGDTGIVLPRLTAVSRDNRIGTITDRVNWLPDPPFESVHAYCMDNYMFGISTAGELYSYGFKTREYISHPHGVVKELGIIETRDPGGVIVGQVVVIFRRQGLDETRFFDSNSAEFGGVVTTLLHSVNVFDRVRYPSLHQRIKSSSD